MKRPDLTLAAAASPRRILTSREAAVLRLFACGCTYAQAAGQLGVSLHTVVSHVKNAYRKLEVHCAAAAVMRAVELRLLEDERIP